MMRHELLQRLYSVDRPVYDYGIEPPHWISETISTLDVAAIIEGGCQSGTYPPAVEYRQALETMRRYGDEIFEFIKDNQWELPRFEITSWKAGAVEIVSTAVEMWCNNVADELAERIRWDGDE